MDLDIEIYLDGGWHQAAKLKFKDPSKGHLGSTLLEYDPAYFLERAAIDLSNGQSLSDNRALSVRFPVDLAVHSLPTWPAFLLDMMPQGYARRQMDGMLKKDLREFDLPLLLRFGETTIGNIRIAQATREEQKRLAEIKSVGVTWDDIIHKSEAFLEVFERHVMLPSGASGLQGEWPKIAMTLADDDLYYPDSLVPDEKARAFFVVKLLRSDKEADKNILRLEGAYSRIARDLGLRVHQESFHSDGVLVIPRFDRRVDERKIVRYGQESLVSALGKAEYGYVGTHEEYIELIRQHSSDPDGDIVEYVCRDVANIAMGNTDNHGRNTAFTKYDDGRIELSPLFDFSPMRLADESVIRSTRWACMRDRKGGDSSPNWAIVCRSIYPEDSAAVERLLIRLQEFALGLDGVRGKLMEEHGDISASVQRALARCDDVMESLKKSGHSWEWK